MNFDFGEILSRAFQITWKHKILWVFSALPMLLSFLVFPFIFVPMFFIDAGSHNTPFFMDSPIYVILFFLLFIFILLFSYVLYGISSSAVILGTVRADEEDVESFTIRGLFEDSRKYWWRVLGVLLLIGLGVSVIFMAIFGCMAILGAVTIGLGYICMFPLMLLMYPAMLVLYGVIEESQVAVIVDDLGVTDAIRRGWELVRANFWRIVLISLVVYVGIGILSSIVMLPLMSPFFFIPFLTDSRQFDPSPRTTMLFMGGFSLFFLPVMAFVQGIGITFLKSTYALVYLRLTKPQDNAPVVLETKE